MSYQSFRFNKDFFDNFLRRIRLKNTDELSVFVAYNLNVSWFILIVSFDVLKIFNSLLWNILLLTWLLLIKTWAIRDYCFIRNTTLRDFHACIVVRKTILFAERIAVFEWTIVSQLISHLIAYLIALLLFCFYWTILRWCICSSIL